MGPGTFVTVETEVQNGDEPELVYAEANRWPFVVEWERKLPWGKYRTGHPERIKVKGPFVGEIVITNPDESDWEEMQDIESWDYVEYGKEQS